MFKRPLVAISTVALLICWAFPYAAASGDEPGEDLVMSIALGLFIGFCPAFNLVKGLGRSPLVKDWRCSLILSLPAVLAVAVSFWEFIAPSTSPASVWWLAQFVVLPVVWAVAGSYWAGRRPLPNSSSKPTPLRGAA